MKLAKRIVKLCATALVAAAIPAFAQYPQKPVKIIVPYPPGGTTDILARIVAGQLTASLGETFIVENKPGASGAIGTQLVARSAPDGYTLLMGTINTHGINSALNKQLPYDAIKDFAPITIVASTPNVLAVHPDVPVKTLAELLALARAQPDKLSFGSTSTGGSPHMSGELLKMMANVSMVHIPYKGAGPMLSDLLGGQIPIGFDNMPSTIGHIRSGKLRAIAVTTSKRWAGAPEVPTIAESGVPGYEVSAWFGLLAPAGTPAAVVEALHRAIGAAIRRPDVEKRLVDIGAEPVGNTPAQFARHIGDEVAKWQKVVDATGLKVE